MDRLCNKVREWCSVDIRSLALFRMGLALILLTDIAIRVQDLGAHYTDAGVLPRDLLVAKYMNAWHLSLHLINGTWIFSALCFGVAALCAVALLLGYRTRAATVASWILLISLHSRNPLVLQGGDMLLRLLLFWSMFLPLGACWSVDRRLGRSPPPTATQYCSLGALGLLLQVCFVYWFTALLKSDPVWRTEGTAVWYALSVEQFSTEFGKVLLAYPALLKVLTFATLYLEMLGPFLAFSPIFTAQLRTATAAVFIFFHFVALNLTMDLGIFSFVCTVAWIPFLPGWFWRHAAGCDDTPAAGWNGTRLLNGTAALCIMYIFLWNLRTLGVAVPLLTSTPLNLVGPILRIDQYWNMFSPYPIRDDGWFVIPARQRNGSQVDLFAGGKPLSWERPPLLSAVYTSDRWKSYSMTLFFSGDPAMMSAYARYLGRCWNDTHTYEEMIKSLEIVFMANVNTYGEPREAPDRRVLWIHSFKTLPPLPSPQNVSIRLKDPIGL